MSTERLYYNDCYRAVFDAAIVEISNKGRRVYLDRTCFYPTSGGQPHDLGLLNGRAVVDVIDEGERIAHVLAEELSGASVHAEIDWKRRYDHMQQHTGQHLLSAVFAEGIKAATLSFHLGPDVSTIELGCKKLSDEEIDRAEARANELAWSALPVRAVYENADTAEGLRKASERTGELRIIEIEGVDRSACGGTHVRSTAELAPLQIRGMERVRGNVRIEFVCGGRAAMRSKADFRLLGQLARDSGTAIDGVSEFVARLRRKVTESEKQERALTGELNRLEAAELYRTAIPDADGMRRFVFRHQEIGERAKGLAIILASYPKSVVVMATPASVMMAASKDSGCNAGQLLKAALAKHGGRGGGSAELAQGSLPDEAAVDAVTRELGSEAEHAEKRAATE